MGIDMGFMLKCFPEKQYAEILKEVGAYQYHRYDKGEVLPGGMFKELPRFQDYNFAITGTGATIADYSFTYADRYTDYPAITIPKGSQLFVVRFLRYDDRHGDPHYNADDQLIFPTLEGNILRMPRKSHQDHFIEIAKGTEISTVAEAYKLPKEKHGPINKYFEDGASLPIEIFSIEDS